MTDVRYASDADGKKAYNAYGWYVGHKTYDGKPMPKWEDLTPKIREAWRVAVNAVTGREGT